VSADQVKESLVAQVPLFAALPRSEIAHLAGHLRLVDYPAATLLLREGERGDRLFILLEGEVEIIKALGSDDERLIAARAAGDFFGEMSLLETAGKRTASARTRTPVKLWELSRADFETLLHRRPALAYEMLREISQRLRTAQEGRIADLHEKNRRLTEAYEELRAAHAEIVEKEKLDHEMDLARQIQERILPRRLPQPDGFELAARVVPARAVGGDLFDFIPLAPNLTAIAVGDVTGKGLAAAIFMALTRSLLRAEAGPLATPVETLRRVNGLLRDINDSATFVTMLYGVLDGDTHQFTYARAGHELPLLLGPCGETFTPDAGHAHPLGMFANPAIDERTIALPPGSTLLLYTDGATDVRDASGGRFGWDRFCAAAQASLADSAQQFCDSLWQAIAAFQGAGEQADDVTLAVVYAK